MVQYIVFIIRHSMWPSVGISALLKTFIARRDVQCSSAEKLLQSLLCLCQCDQCISLLTHALFLLLLKE